MSYCRWSSDNMRSDVYAYEDCMGGYTIHVRGVHPVNPEILPRFPGEAVKDRDVETIQEWLSKKREAHPKLVYEGIGLKYDDKTYSFETLQGLQDFLVELKVLGYYVPDTTFDIIQEEIEDDQ